MFFQNKTSSSSFWRQIVCLNYFLHLFKSCSEKNSKLLILVSRTLMSFSKLLEAAHSPETLLFPINSKLSFSVEARNKRRELKKKNFPLWIGKLCQVVPHVFMKRILWSVCWNCKRKLGICEAFIRFIMCHPILLSAFSIN